MVASHTATSRMVDVQPPAHLIQYITALAVTMGAFSYGTCLGYTSPAGPMLMTNTTDPEELTLTKEENSWFSASFNLGALVAGPLGGMAIKAVGRRWTMLGSVPIMVGSWALIAFGQNFAMLISGRVIGGVFTGLTCINLPSYIGEIASADIRGSLATAFQLMVVSGILFAYIVGAFMTSWRVLAIVCAAPVLIFAILSFLTAHESPAYLLSKGKVKEARAVLQHFRGKQYNVEPELQALIQLQEEAEKSQVSLKDLRAPYIMRPLMISVGLMFFQQFSGVNAVLFNLNDIFTAANTSLDEDVNAIIVGVVMVLATGVAAVLVDRLGRKVLLTLSATVMILSLVALDVFFLEKDLDSDKASETLGWLPLTSLIVYIAVYSLGYGPIPWIMMGELFSPNVRDAASGISTMTNWGCSFFVTLAFVPLQDAIGPYGVYWLFAGFCVLNLIFVIMVIPETKGKTLQEITAYFGGPTPARAPSNASYDNQPTYTIDTESQHNMT